MLRFPRLGCSMRKVIPPLLLPGITPLDTRPRCGSPVSGCSTLITSAPQSASTAPAAGTNVHAASSTTRTPSIAPIIPVLRLVLPAGTQSSAWRPVPAPAGRLRSTMDGLTGFADGPPLGPPDGLITAIRRLGNAAGVD